VKEGDIIEAFDDYPLHLSDCRRTPCHTKAKLCCPPVLFDKVEFAMVFGVEVAQVAPRLDQLLKLGLLRYEVGL
jgi:hypothetical protein